MIIDWRRCAEPQADEHDTQAALQLVTTTTSPLRKVPHRRRLPMGAPTIFDGAVAVRYVAETCPDHPRNQNGPLRHRHIDRAVEYVRRWPLGFKQFRALMDTFHPMIDASVAPSEYGVKLGSNSHSDEDKWGTMYATIFDPIGLAEAFMHEMAHNKLRALGVYVNTAQRIVANPPEEMYESPIRKDRMRPMSAVLHAQFSFIYVTQMDLHMLIPETDARARNGMLSLLAHNVPRMELGFDEIRRSLRTDLIGQQFVDGFFEWSERLLAEANRVLEENGVPKPPIERTPTAVRD